MPEGPEVHRHADRLRRYLADQRAEEVWFAFDRLQEWGEELRGQPIEAVEARGKALLIRFQRVAIYVHLQLYGRWELRRPNSKDPNTTRSLRMKIVTAKGRALLYSASEIQVLDPEDEAEHSYLSKLGPDVLDSGLTVGAIQERYRSKRFRRRSLGALLLDQGFLGGVGNYLRSEILFEAGLPPRARPADLDEHQLRALARATRTICRRAYRTGGVTNDPERVADLKAEGVRRRALRWHVFGREGKPCWSCGAEIQREEVGSRRLYSCPICQPAVDRSRARAT
jgi:endonuclease VIII